tara:strand:- start:2045 stop:2773 length:729 start_codon:yes stop_codon:yes gene_type:complete
MKNFLKANWKNLIMINFEVSPKLLLPLVPAGTELDLWKNKAFVSIIAFLFDEVKVLGIPAFGNKKFEELNIRFYIKRFDGKNIKRGVAFVKEIVPKPLVTRVANFFFSEHYQTMKMSHEFSFTDINQKKIQNLEYVVKKDKSYRFSARLTSKLTDLEEGSFEEFIAEHYWGYSRVNDHKTIEYRVQHPKWEIFKESDVEFKCDFEKLYGNQWEFLNLKKPHSTFVAKGSKVNVGFPKVLIFK